MNDPVQTALESAERALRMMRAMAEQALNDAETKGKMQKAYTQLAACIEAQNALRDLRKPHGH